MKTKILIFCILIAGLISLISGFSSNNKNLSGSKNKFSTYWYDGKAELTSYNLVQNRYGELHKGHAVMVFVTEDFSKKKQVKLDNIQNSDSDRQPILKLNFSKNFLTGIYPYSILNSVFTPVDLSGTIKTSCSIQEWCGHTFTQINKSKDGFITNQFSYFESEGDKVNELSSGILEDELWNLIRIDPSKLPVGKIKLLRGNVAVRLMHLPLAYVQVDIKKSKTKLDGNEVEMLAINYPERKLVIYFDQNFPHTILGWDETYSEFGKSPATTTGRIIKTLRLPYWQLHNNEHVIYRDSLGI